MTSNTRDKSAPYVDEVCEGVWLAAGGCGYAAKSCDEIGRIAAVLATTGNWDSEIQREKMNVKWKNT